MISLVSVKIDEDVIASVEKVLRSGQLAEGPVVKEFETLFAGYIGVPHAVAVSNGTTALHAALLAAGVKPGDEVITTPFSFIATANAILYSNAVPVFADIDPVTYTIDPREIEKKITKKTKAVICVHLYGLPCDMDAITALCKKHNLALIEDACQAHGSTFKGRKTGVFGLGCYSFYATKNLPTGEGGMITAPDERTDSTLRSLRNHGRAGQYLHDVLGYNYRLTDIAAALGIGSLKKLDDYNLRRNENAAYLTQEIKNIKGLVPPVVPTDRTHVFHQYTLRVTEDFGISRDELQQKLKDQGIGSGIIYPLPIHQQPLYQKLGYKDSLPAAEQAAREVLSLPVHQHLTNNDLEKIIEGLKNAR
jgi:dTDP-4-amino-4,6-dideoxygalactose transaminase